MTYVTYIRTYVYSITYIKKKYNSPHALPTARLGGRPQKRIPEWGKPPGAISVDEALVSGLSDHNNREWRGRRWDAGVMALWKHYRSLRKA